MFTASAFIDPAPSIRPTGALTPSRLFAEEFARTLSRSDVFRFDRGLQNIERATDWFVRSRINALHPRCSPGVSVMDGVGAEEVLVVYADGRKLGGVGVAGLPLLALRESTAIARRHNAGERRRILVDATVALRPKERPSDRWEGVDDLKAVALDLAVIAGLLLNNHNLEWLGSIRNAIPAVAIVALTDIRGRPTVNTRHIITSFPGDWLGTRSPAGTA